MEGKIHTEFATQNNPQQTGQVIICDIVIINDIAVIQYEQSKLQITPGP